MAHSQKMNPAFIIADGLSTAVSKIVKSVVDFFDAINLANQRTNQVKLMSDMSDAQLMDNFAIERTDIVAFVFSKT